MDGKYFYYLLKYQLLSNINSKDYLFVCSKGIFLFLVHVLVESGFVRQNCAAHTTKIIRPHLTTEKIRTRKKSNMKTWTTKLINCSYSC